MFGNLTNSQFYGMIHLTCFRPEIPFSGKFGSQNQKFLLEVKFGTETISNMQNSVVMFTFPVFDQKYELKSELKFGNMTN